MGGRRLPRAGRMHGVLGDALRRASFLLALALVLGAGPLAAGALAGSSATPVGSQAGTVYASAGQASAQPSPSPSAPAKSQTVGFVLAGLAAAAVFIAIIGFSVVRSRRRARNQR
jgi:hypothetical protein